MAYNHTIKNVKFMHFKLGLEFVNKDVFYSLEPFSLKNDNFKKKTYLKRSFFFKAFPESFFKKRFVSGGGFLFKLFTNLNGDFINNLKFMKNTPNIFISNKLYLSSDKISSLSLNTAYKNVFMKFLLKILSINVRILTNKPGLVCLLKL
jgi:hypothetical protein